MLSLEKTEEKLDLAGLIQEERNIFSSIAGLPLPEEKEKEISEMPVLLKFNILTEAVRKLQSKGLIR